MAVSSASGSESSEDGKKEVLPQIQWVVYLNESLNSTWSSSSILTIAVLTWIYRNGEPQTSPSEITEGCSRWIKASYSFLYVEVSSLILLFACIALWSPTSLMKYAISVAGISFGICIILQTMDFLTPGFLKKPLIGDHSIEKLCSVFLLIWWIFGTCFITFKG